MPRTKKTCRTKKCKLKKNGSCIWKYTGGAAAAGGGGGGEGEEETCSICLGAYVNPYSIYNCNHVTCLTCLIQNMLAPYVVNGPIQGGNSECSICRAQINPGKLQTFTTRVYEILRGAPHIPPPVASRLMENSKRLYTSAVSLLRGTALSLRTRTNVRTAIFIGGGVVIIQNMKTILNFLLEVLRRSTGPFITPSIDSVFWTPMMFVYTNYPAVEHVIMCANPNEEAPSVTSLINKIAKRTVIAIAIDQFPVIIRVIFSISDEQQINFFNFMFRRFLSLFGGGKESINENDHNIIIDNNNYLEFIEVLKKVNIDFDDKLFFSIVEYYDKSQTFTPSCN